MKARPLVSEVRPLMEQNHTQERRVSWNQDQDQTQLSAEDPDQHQSQTGEQETSSAQHAQRTSPLKKKVQTMVQESRRNLGPTARAAASHLNSSSGLRKAQSVQNLLTDTGTPSRL